MAGWRLIFSLCLAGLLGTIPWLGGCAPDTKVYAPTDAAGELPVGIPRQAKLLWGGNNDKLKWEFGSAGHYWIVDDSNGVTLIEGDVKSGEQLEVDPKAHLVMLNHAFLPADRIDEGRDLRLYFAEQPPATGPASGPAAK